MAYQYAPKLAGIGKQLAKKVEVTDFPVVGKGVAGLPKRKKDRLTPQLPEIFAAGVVSGGDIFGYGTQFSFAPEIQFQNLGAAVSLGLSQATVESNSIRTFSTPYLDNNIAYTYYFKNTGSNMVRVEYPKTTKQFVVRSFSQSTNKYKGVSNDGKWLVGNQGSNTTYGIYQTSADYNSITLNTSISGTFFNTDVGMGFFADSKKIIIRETASLWNTYALDEGSNTWVFKKQNTFNLSANALGDFVGSTQDGTRLFIITRNATNNNDSIYGIVYEPKTDTFISFQTLRSSILNSVQSTFGIFSTADGNGIAISDLNEGSSANSAFIIEKSDTGFDIQVSLISSAGSGTLYFILGTGVSRKGNPIVYIAKRENSPNDSILVYEKIKGTYQQVAVFNAFFENSDSTTTKYASWPGCYQGDKL